MQQNSSLSHHRLLPREKQLQLKRDRSSWTSGAKKNGAPVALSQYSWEKGFEDSGKGSGKGNAPNGAAWKARDKATSCFINISGLRLSHNSLRQGKQAESFKNPAVECRKRPKSAKPTVNRDRVTGRKVRGVQKPSQKTRYCEKRYPLSTEDPQEQQAFYSIRNNTSKLSHCTQRADRSGGQRESKVSEHRHGLPYGRAQSSFSKTAASLERHAPRTSSIAKPTESFPAEKLTKKTCFETATDSRSCQQRSLSSHHLERRRIQKFISSHKWDGYGKPDLYIFGKEMGKGSFGIVKLAHHKITGHKVAIKIYDKTKFKKPSQIKRCRQEISLMSKLNSNYIVHLFEAYETSKKTFLVMEALSGGNLCTYVKSKRHLQEDEALVIFSQVALALQYLHYAVGVVHRDIKLENILFTSCRKIKVADFGFSVFITGTEEQGNHSQPSVLSKKKCLKSFCGTPSYMAPEIIRKQGYDGFPVDVWSFGVVLYAMLYGRFPFRAKNHEELYRLILMGQFSFPESRQGAVSVASLNLLKHMICLDPRQRITVKGILQQEHVSTVVENLVAGKSAKPETLFHLSKTSSVSSAENIATLHLVSKNPASDLKESLLRQLVRFGFAYHRLKRHILNKDRNHITTTYYLLRMKQAKRRKE